MNRQLVSQLVAQTVAKVMGTGLVPSVQTGTVVEEGTQPLVLLDAASSNPAAVPTACRVAGDPPGSGERVLVIVAAGAGWVVGRLSGAVRGLGLVAGDADDTFTAVEVLDTLTAEVVVNQPGRILKISGQGLFSVDTPAASVVVRIRQDGVNIGRVGTHTFPLANTGETLSGWTTVIDPDPGAYTFDITGTATGGVGTYAGATSTGHLLVEDVSNLAAYQP